MKVTIETHPALYKAMFEVELDNGGGHVGMAYPGGWDAAGNPIHEPLDLSEFEVPEAWEILVAPAEGALSALLAESLEEFEIFCCGDEADMEAIRDRSEGLAAAHRLLNALFDDWSEDAP